MADDPSDEVDIAGDESPEGEGDAGAPKDLDGKLDEIEDLLSKCRDAAKDVSIEKLTNLDKVVGRLDQAKFSLEGVVQALAGEEPEPGVDDDETMLQMSLRRRRGAHKGGGVLAAMKKLGNMTPTPKKKAKRRK